MDRSMLADKVGDFMAKVRQNLRQLLVPQRQ
jgi:hypothetical protein